MIAVGSNKVEAFRHADFDDYTEHFFGLVCGRLLAQFAQGVPCLEEDAGFEVRHGDDLAQGFDGCGGVTCVLEVARALKRGPWLAERYLGMGLDEFRERDVAKERISDLAMDRRRVERYEI